MANLNILDFNKFMKYYELGFHSVFPNETPWACSRINPLFVKGWTEEDAFDLGRSQGESALGFWEREQKFKKAS